jgi:hypothetical protein
VKAGYRTLQLFIGSAPVGPLVGAALAAKKNNQSERQPLFTTGHRELGGKDKKSGQLCTVPALVY